MSKAYSTKALPPGTVLREWRLEEVLGVGGFGIVYKGRGIYFGELVAIKEYFPSSISERNEDDTVVPVDSDSEEVHALGLKKFVEEAKLLWNLSTPTRHPNIVNVRSLFEVHGTAYMVMDFEDGVSLSRMLKRGDKFNESSLANLIKPIAEGLERAHRVGVLHRDIKPPNILVNEDGRSVLIDFGSARFESADATSTKVTFHTPPYAAIEQYVKTYEQGPWTDIYALGVVLYECVTGQKPADVLERLHGGDEKRLVDGNWPGYSKIFLAAVDAAMTIKPADRPQSIAEWLALFDGTSASPDAASDDDDDEDATRVMAYAEAPDEIVPVAPPLPGFSQTEKPPTNIPDDPKQVKFKRAGQDTGAGRRTDHLPQPDVVPPDPSAGEPAAATVTPDKEPEAARAGAKGRAAQPKAKPGEADLRPRKRVGPLVLGAAGLALAAAGGGWLMFGGGKSSQIDEGLLDAEPATASPSATGADTGDLAASLNALLADARRAGAPAQAIAPLAKVAEELAKPALLPAGTGAAAGATAPPPSADAKVKAAGAQFAAGLLSDGERRTRQLAGSVPWASATNANSARQETGSRQALARSLRSSFQSLRAAAAAAASASTSSEALAASRKALTDWRSVVSSAQTAYRAHSVPVPEVTSSAAAVEATVSATATPEARATSAGVSGAKKSQFNSVVSRARQLVRQVNRLPSGSRPGSRATDAERDAYRARQADKGAARDYERYLDRLEASMRGAKSDGEADQLIGQALQTEDYLRVMLNRASAN